MEDIDLDVNIEDVEGGDDTFIKPGRYLLKVVKISRDWSKDGKKEFISCELRTVDTQDPKLEESIDRPVYEIFNLGASAMWKLKSFLTAIYPGLTGGKIPGDIIGKVVSGVVFVDTYNGNENFRVKRFVNADEWEGLNFRVDNGELVSESSGNGAKPKANGKPSGTRKKAPAQISSGEDEVEL